MGILIGTDFCDGLKGVGAKTALKLAHKGQLKEKEEHTLNLQHQHLLYAHKQENLLYHIE